MKDDDRKKDRQTQGFIQDKLWEMTFNAVPDAVAIIDRNHQIVQVNKAMAERLGVTPEQCTGLTCHAVVHGLEAPPPFCPHSRLLKDGSEQREEVHEQRLGGTFIVTVSPLLDETGRLQGSVHVAHDITQRKQMEDDLLSLNCELQESNKNLQAAYQWMRDNRDLLRNSRYEEVLGFLVDREGHIEWISEKVSEYTGKSRNELIACNIVDLFQPSCRDHLNHFCQDRGKVV
jgi:PAS domain S-box-containing protein